MEEQNQDHSKPHPVQLILVSAQVKQIKVWSHDAEEFSSGHFLKASEVRQNRTPFESCPHSGVQHNSLTQKPNTPSADLKQTMIYYIN